MPSIPRYASRPPSGDHAGSSPKTVLTRRRPLPSAFITHRFQLPDRVLPNAICVPSGDHDGSASSTVEPLEDVSCVCALPSAFITQMRKRPPRELS